MASWLPETLFEIVGQGPAPSKDYYQLLVTRSQNVISMGAGVYLFRLEQRNVLCACGMWNERNAVTSQDISHSPMNVIFRWWKISLRSEYRSAKPGEVKEPHPYFLENSHLQVQIALVFGAKILDYVFNLCEGKLDYLERLSDSLLLHIISYLDLEDIASLSQTSQRFSKLCISDKLWEPIVQSACDDITPEMRALAKDVGWRQLFFANKLQLQQKFRKRGRHGHQRGSQA